MLTRPKSIMLTFAAAATFAAPAIAQEQNWIHGSALVGELKYPAGFEHFDYVNPEAPKGGVVRLESLGSFDTFNPILPQGETATGLGLIFESLMTSSMDEISTAYGLLAESMSFPDDYSSVTFRLNPKAMWQDGNFVTPEDVVWSFEKLIEASPNTAQYYANVESAEVTGVLDVTFSFSETGNRELPQIMGQVPVLPKHWWEGTDAEGNPRDIMSSTLEPPLGSGPYRIASFEPGRTVVYERVEDYWGANEPVNVGQNNFDGIRYEYFRDTTVAFEAFKGDTFDWWNENIARRWATGYDFPAVADGRVILERFENPYRDSGLMVGFIMNLRRPQFEDPRVREALNYAFDFETLQRDIFYGEYNRISSYFYPTELASSGLPEGEELEILNSVRDLIPDTVFNEPYTNPVAGSPEALRTNLQSALTLLNEAGYELRLPDDGLSPIWFAGGAILLGGAALLLGRRRRLVLAVGAVVLVGLGYGAYALWLKPPTVEKPTLVNAGTQEPLTFEILLNGPSIEPVALSWQGNLDSIGIEANVRTVDSPQFVNRLRSRDYDAVYYLWQQSLSPGNEQRFFWGGEAADQDNSSNFAGVSDAGVDALIDKIIFADDRDTLVAATRALDRVLLALHFVIPSYAAIDARIAHWDRFGHPDNLPEYSIGFPTIWWWDAEKAAATGGGGAEE